jgi:hypothetical protein
MHRRSGNTAPETRGTPPASLQREELDVYRALSWALLALAVIGVVISAGLA